MFYEKLYKHGEELGVAKIHGQIRERSRERYYSRSKERMNKKPLKRGDIDYICEEEEVIKLYIWVFGQIAINVNIVLIVIGYIYTIERGKRKKLRNRNGGSLG